MGWGGGETEGEDKLNCEKMQNNTSRWVKGNECTMGLDYYLLKLLDVVIIALSDIGIKTNR